MYVSEYDRYPESRAPDQFLAAAKVLCGEHKALGGLGGALWTVGWPNHRPHPLDVARRELLHEVRELLGDRALPCNCLQASKPGYPGWAGHTVACVTVGYARTVEESERWMEKIREEMRAAWHPPLVAENYCVGPFA